MTRALIVMATHNPRPALLQRQFVSIRTQTVEDFDCVVFDDASTNRAEVSALCAQDQRFTLMPARPHLGHYAAFEHLLSTAESDMPVFLCDQDDAWRPDKLERMLESVAKGADAAFSAMRVVDADGVVVRDRFLARQPDDHALEPAALLLMNSVSGAALCVSARVIRAALPFPGPRLRGWHDQWLAAVSARIGKLEYLDEPLVDYTQHRGQVVGDGLRSLTKERLRGYAGRTWSPALLASDLRSRTRWITAAATHLLKLPGGPDPDLQALARGRWSRHLAYQVWSGVMRGDVPPARGALISAGFTLR